MAPAPRSILLLKSRRWLVYPCVGSFMPCAPKCATEQNEHPSVSLSTETTAALFSDS